jgi:hypothetical protein
LINKEKKRKKGGGWWLGLKKMVSLSFFCFCFEDLGIMRWFCDYGCLVESFLYLIYFSLLFLFFLFSLFLSHFSFFSIYFSPLLFLYLVAAYLKINKLCENVKNI